MHRILLLMLLVIPAIQGLAQQTIIDSIEHDGIQRSFILYVPDNYSPAEAAPLLLNLHGRSRSADNQMRIGDFRPVADTAGFLIVHPQGTKDSLGRTHWNFRPADFDVDDVGFLAALIDSISAEYTIDQDRVYSAGFSNGGFMSLYLGCQLGDKLAGVGSVGGAIVDSTGCYLGMPMPMIQVHGTSDGTVSYTNYNIPFLVQLWASYNNCDASSSSQSMQNKSINDGSTVTKITYKNCDNDIHIVHLRVNNGNHTWPDPNGIGTINQDIDASREIWEYFAQYDLSGRVDFSSVSALDAFGMEFAPNPVHNKLQVKRQSNESMQYWVYNAQGLLIISGTINQQEAQISTAELLPGIYYFTTRTGNMRFIKE